MAEKWYMGVFWDDPQPEQKQPQLPPEVWHTARFDPAQAHAATLAMCRCGGMHAAADSSRPS